jgi:hypothetical protein
MWEVRHYIRNDRMVSVLLAKPIVVCRAFIKCFKLASLSPSLNLITLFVLTFNHKGCSKWQPSAVDKLHISLTNFKIFESALLWEMFEITCWVFFFSYLPRIDCWHIIYLFIPSWIRFWFVTVTPKYLNCVIFSKDLLATFSSWFCHAFWWWDSNIYL